MTKIFKYLSALFLLAMLSAPASATCFDRQKVAACDKLAEKDRAGCIMKAMYPPIATRDADGTFKLTVNTVFGPKEMSISGVPANLTSLCRNLLFGFEVHKCVGNRLKYDAPRDPSTCKGVGPDGTCAHLECEEIDPKYLPKRKSGR